MAVEGRGDYRQGLIRDFMSRQQKKAARGEVKRKRELAFSSPPKDLRPPRPDMTEQFGEIPFALLGKGLSKGLRTGPWGWATQKIIPDYSTPIKEMSPTERREAAYLGSAFIPGAGDVTDVKQTAEETGWVSPWTGLAATLGLFPLVPAGSIVKGARKGLTSKQKPTTTLKQFWGEDRLDTSNLTPMADTTTRPKIRGVEYYENNLQPLSADELVELNQLLEKGVRTEGARRPGRKGSWFDVANPESVRLRELSARSADEIITVDNPEVLRQVITGVRGGFDQPTSMIGGSTVRPRGAVFEGGFEGALEAGGNLSSIDAEDSLLRAYLNLPGLGEPNLQQIGSRRRAIQDQAEKGKGSLRSRNPEKPGVLDISLEDFEPGTYIIKREPTAEEVLAQLRRTDRQAAGRAKKLNKEFKPTQYTLDDAQDLINQWRSANPDAPWGVWRETTRKNKTGEIISDYDWIAGGTIEHVDPVKTTRKQRVGQKSNVIILDSSLNASKGDRPLFDWLKAIRTAKTDVVDRKGKVIVKKGDLRFAEEADQIAKQYGAVWDPKINGYRMI